MFTIKQKNPIKKQSKRRLRQQHLETIPKNLLLSASVPSSSMPSIDELNELYQCRSGITQTTTYHLPTKLLLKPSPPMLAKPIDPKKIDFTCGYVYEEKFDGERMLATIMSDTKIHFYTRRLTQSNIFRYPICLAQSVMNCIVDGELVYLDDFNKIIPICDTGRRSQCKIQYRIFDIQWFNGTNVTGKSLVERKKLLTQAIVPNENVQIVDYVECVDSVKTMEQFDMVTRNGGEGLILKLKDEPYISDSRNWIKLKSLHINRHKEEYELYARRFMCDKNGIRSILECGYFNDDGTYVHVTNVSSGIDAEKRTKLNLLADPVTGIFSRRLVVTLHADKITMANRSLRHPCLYRIRHDIVAINDAIFKQCNLN